MFHRSTLSRLLAAILALSLVTACEDFPQQDTPPRAAQTKAPPKKGFCPAAGPITRSLLPSPEGVERVATNPCLGVNGLIGMALDVIPEQKMADEAELRTFRQGLRTFASRVTMAADAVDCAYENDHLAVSIYQDPQYDWSVGLVAVVRGDLEAAAEDAVCLLLKQVPFLPDVGFRADGPPTPKFCADAESREAQGYDFMIMWIADSDAMCRSLTHAIRPT
ncbi:hypothetical protein ACFPOI_24975 [Nonomuraea angiospora]|uniref:Lipoprotein n=1 Tax=Nonomuraea angiospora TaxID=46172 RepID=A0ABR9LQL8_9ACTN|nr:hypothetical protein [Nonomuraea angiospora]MBE1582595.1 hypothetical protein [Nonomuraea angiospora]